MKTLQLVLILILIGIHLSTAQQVIPETERLATLGKIHGFLKYYHPNVATGEYDWDEELIKQLPLVLKATNKESLSILYLNWINNLGIVEPCKKCDINEVYFEKNFDLSWMENEDLFNKELTSKLKYIENNRLLENHFYASIGPAGVIQIINEKEYTGFGYPSEEYRLLALFNYWNIIEYFYPYKYLTDQNWNSVLLEMIPKFKNALNKKEYHSYIKNLVAKLDDNHASIKLEESESRYIPVKVSHIENKAVISGYYNDSIARLNDLRLGDIILEIDGQSIESLMKSNLKYISGSNLNGKIKKTYSNLLSGVEDSISLTIDRNGFEKQIVVGRYDFNQFDYWNNTKEIKSKSINDRVGYLKVASIKSPKTIGHIFESFKDKSSIIIDLRKYPNPNYKAFSRYLNSEKRPFATSYIPNLSYPGKFITQDDLESNYSRRAFKGKVILLVNEDTLSFAEFTAMAFQTADNVITIGNQTAGADGNGIYFNFLGGNRTSISGLGIEYPDGTESQRKGVKIDFVVKPTIKGLLQGRDEILEKAIELARK